MCKGFGTYSVGAMANRIGRWLDRATPEQVESGKAWYCTARTFASELAETSPYTLEQVAGVIAVLSPQCNWEQNKIGAWKVVALHENGSSPDLLLDYTGYRANILKAWRVLDGDDTAVRGPKVTAFRDAILGDLSTPVIDVWASRTARSKERNLAFAFRDDESPGRVEMRAMQEAYRRAAAARGLAPGEAQAIAWQSIRESGEWVRPQHMPGNTAKGFYRRHIAARKRLGLTIHVRPGYWGAATNGLEAALSA